MGTDVILFILAPEWRGSASERYVAAEHAFTLEREDFTALWSVFETTGIAMTAPIQIPGGGASTTRRSKVASGEEEGGYLHEDAVYGRPLRALLGATLRKRCVVNAALCRFIAETWPDRYVVLFLH